MAGLALAAATCELFEHWADYRAGKISRAALLRRMGPVRRKVERLLLRGMQSNNARRARDVPGIVRASPVAVDVLASRRGRADEQCGRAVVASCGDLAEALVWDAERRAAAVLSRRC